MSKARAESVRAQKAFEDHMINFEKKKIRDLRVYRNMEFNVGDCFV